MTLSGDEDTQRMLVDSARRWCESACTPEHRAKASHHATGCPPEHWRELGELGWLGLALPQEDGGFGAGLVEQCLLAEQLGRSLLVEPYVACAAMGAGLLEAVATGDLRKAWLPALALGDKRVAWAAWEPDGDTTLRAASAQAKREGQQWRLSGSKGLMPGVAGADGLLVTAQIQDDPARLGLFFLEPSALGAFIDPKRLYDGRHAAELRLENASATLLREGSTVEMLSLLNAVLDSGRVVHGAETLGTAQAAFDITLDYVRTRRQFGRTLGSNQVIQHRLVDLYVELQETRALCLQAAQTRAPRDVAALGLRISQVARHVWEEALQLHGAIGITEEYVVGEFVRRLALAADLYGNGPACAERLAHLSLEIPA